MLTRKITSTEPSAGGGAPIANASANPTTAISNANNNSGASNNGSSSNTSNNTSHSKKLNRCRSFHFRYLELCRSKNVAPLSEIRLKNNATTVLEFFGDKIQVTDWMLIIEALFNDQVLQNLVIKSRKTFGVVMELLDNEKKAKLFRQKPVLYTKFVFSALVEALTNCIEFNKNLKVLSLEGLPFNANYIGLLARALASNESIKELSFQRSSLLDEGCELICNTVKYMENVSKLNLSECGLTARGAEFIADMIRIQKISRYTEGWQKSLRYREVNTEAMDGLRTLMIARNPEIGDDGVKSIVEVLKEDVWIKWLDMQQCGITDRGANLILDCLDVNNYILDLNVNENPGISKFLLRNIHDRLGKGNEDGAVDCGAGGDGFNKGGKTTMAQLKEQLKSLNEQLVFERTLRKKAEVLNERLNQQIISYETRLKEGVGSCGVASGELTPLETLPNGEKLNIPEGYLIIKNESLQSIIRERDEYHKMVMMRRDESHSEDSEATPSDIDSKKEELDNLAYYERDDDGDEEEDVDEDTENEEEDDEEDEDSGTARGPAPTLAQMQAQRDAIAQEKQQQRKTLKMRKVKSEMKYVEPMPKSTHRNDSKSDQEFINDSANFCTVRFETNIGDGHANNPGPGAKHTVVSRQTIRNEHRNSLLSANSAKTNFEIDQLSLVSMCSSASSSSHNSDTLRNDYNPMKVFFTQGIGARDGSQTATTMKPSAGPPTQRAKSPRSLFMGIPDD